VAKKKLTIDQRGRVAEKIMELGNLAFVGLILGQALAGRPFDFRLATIGAVGILIAYFVALRIMRGGEK
jgi:hypothetical protein